MELVSHSADDNVVRWILGILAPVGLWLLNMLNNKVDRKVSKDTFEQFEKRSDEQHACTQNTQFNQDKKLDKILDKLEGKQDKHPGGGPRER